MMTTRADRQAATGHRKDTSELGHRLNAVARSQADKAFEDLYECLMDFGSSPEEIEDLMRTALFEHIRAACSIWGPMFAADERVHGNLRRCIQREVGLKSGAARAKRSKKHAFLSWASEVNAANPTLSKNAVAERYARENPGISVNSLRRYLADIRTVGVD